MVKKLRTVSEGRPLQSVYITCKGTAATLTKAIMRILSDSCIISSPSFS